MSAIDNRNWRRQSGKSVEALERVCVTRSTKGRIFINAVGWIIVNLFLAKKHFVYGRIQVTEYGCLRIIPERNGRARLGLQPG